MHQNVELKARCHDLAAARAKAESLGAKLHEQLHQIDSYFHAPSGRLKLREIAGHGAELIGYHRADETAARACSYARVPIPDPRTTKQLLASTLGLRGVVKKQREVWLWKNVRIHLDHIEGLGSFLEFEAVLGPTDSSADAEQLLAQLRAHFAIAENDLIAVSNIDLLERIAR